MVALGGEPGQNECSHGRLFDRSHRIAFHGGNATRGGRLVSELAELAAALSLFHAAIHAATYHLLLRHLQAGGRAPARTIDQFLDLRRVSYLDLAAYGALVFALLERA